MAASAKSVNTGISAKKVRRIVDLVRGKKVEDALQALQFMPSPAAGQVAKVVRAATANAENEMLSRASDLKIVEIYADEAKSLKRIRALPRGRAARISKRSSHITVVVEEEERQLGQ